jgi:hypothetical protein
MYIYIYIMYNIIYTYNMRYIYIYRLYAMVMAASHSAPPLYRSLLTL